MFAELIVILTLILANGVLSGAEIAVVSLRRTRVEQLLDEKRLGAEALAGLRAQPERFLATVQIGITVIGTTAAAFGGSTLARHLQPLIARIDWLASEAAADRARPGGRGDLVPDAGSGRAGAQIAGAARGRDLRAGWSRVPCAGYRPPPTRWW